MTLADTISRHWQARAPRERRMLALMLVAIGAFVYWFALAAPLRDWARSAEQRHAQALAEQAALEPMIAALSAAGLASTPSPRLAAADLARSARELGLEVRESVESPDGVRMSLGPAPPERLFAWLEQQRHAGHGPRTAQLVASDEGVVADLVF